MNRILLILVSLASLCAAPSTQPAHKTWFATTRPVAATNSGLTADAPISVATIFSRNHWSNGDTVYLSHGESFPGIQFPGKASGGGLTSDGTATVNAPGVVLASVSGAWDIGNIKLDDVSRDPSLPGFVAHRGGYGITCVMTDAATIRIHDLSIRHFVWGIDFENIHHEEGTIIENVLLEDIYSDPQTRCQGIYCEGQYNSHVRNLTVRRVGFRTPQFTGATTQDWAAYWKGPNTDPKGNGPIDLRNSLFVDCSAGPTSNCGGTIDHCTIVRCNNQRAGVPGFLSGDTGVFTSNTLIATWYNLISRNLDVEGNVVIEPGDFAFNLDVPSGEKNWRTVANVIQSKNNLVFGAELAWRQNNLGGGTLNFDGSDELFPDAHLNDIVNNFGRVAGN